jgi:hypothetical protein
VQGNALNGSSGAKLITTCDFRSRADWLVVFRARLIKEPATGSIPMPCHFYRAHSSYNRLAVKWVLLKNTPSDQK